MNDEAMCLNEPMICQPQPSGIRQKISAEPSRHSGARNIEKQRYHSNSDE